MITEAAAYSYGDIYFCYRWWRELTCPKNSVTVKLLMTKVVQFVPTTFLKTHGLTLYLMHFLTLITMSSSTLTFSKKIYPRPHLCSKIAWEVENSKCENHFKCGPKKCEMMRGFQIWPQNSNRITFDPHFSQKKTVKNGNISDLAYFRQFFWGGKRVPRLFNWSFEARFGILSSFRTS